MTETIVTKHLATAEVHEIMASVKMCADNASRLGEDQIACCLEMVSFCLSSEVLFTKLHAYIHDIADVPMSKNRLATALIDALLEKSQAQNDN